MKRVLLKNENRFQQERLVSFKRFFEGTMEKEYVYIFIRQDLSNEQQLVQGAHVALVLGNKLKDRDVSELYFSVIGIPQLSDFCGVMKDLKKHGTKYEIFYEPDQGNTITAIATHPIHEDDRDNLLSYKRLRF